MDDLTSLFGACGGSLERHELADLGWTETTVRRALRDGDIVRIRFGTYAHGPTWRRADPVERHRILTRAVLGKLGRHVYASHHSAAALHGLDLWGVDLAEVQVGRLDGRSDRLDAGVRFHRGAIDAASLVEIDGVLVAPAGRAAIETALGAPVECGAVTLTSAMRTGAASRSEIDTLVRTFGRWPGAVSASRAATLADPRLESVGEVRSMCFFGAHAIPLPEPQHEIYDDDGRLVARSDFWWRLYRHVGEFDGLVKYGRLNPYATDVGRVLVDEKRREDAVRRLVNGVSRWTWHELDPPRAGMLATRLRTDLERSAQLSRRVIDVGA
ncbi:type IV toxin-antitoxin system AbiEi family antitoxin domain-containing protein [Aeromicrobium alkaliterrae]|uniref:Transcriptional regulator, AbiEi antitoxin, Type IV TA system n=1 Tax=Aeromicrobium alkaliterrae TaxID=302168 RepID=A0ABP4VVR3_9ACTN